jgi:hypothetical protein
MRYYPQFSRQYIEDELPLDQARAFMAAAIENDSWLMVKRVGPGYMAQEIAKLLGSGKI